MARKRFWFGVFLVIFNFAFTLAAAIYLGYNFNMTGAKTASMIYGCGWGILGLGCLLAGKDGYHYSKKLMKRCFFYGD